MKSAIHFLILTLFLATNLRAQEDYKISWDYKDLLFKEFVLKAESTLPIKFFYKDEWITDLKLSSYSNCNTLSCVLDNLFRGTVLHYYIDDSGNIVVTRNFAVKILAMPLQKEVSYLPPTENIISMKDQLTEESKIVSIGNSDERNKSGNVIISGYVTNKANNEPVAGVTVAVPKLSKGAVTNEFGFYTLALPRGAYSIKYSFIGMREKYINLNLFGTGTLNVEMDGKVISLKEVFVSNQKNSTLQRFEVGAEKINIASFKLLPTSMGEVDIMKSLILVPGVQSVGEGSNGFNVRGGSADQNLILLYGAPIYNSNHFFGFFSAVNSDVIKDVTLYKGGIPSRYGGRISSVLDIESKEGNKKEFAGNAGISPITTHVMVEGPLIKDTLSYLLTARTTYSNWIFGLIKDPSLHNSSAAFYDLNGKITYNIDKKNKLDLSSYYSHDSFRFNFNSYSYDNSVTALKWIHFFNSSFFSAFSLNNSYYRYNISNLITPSEAYLLSHNINSTGLKADFNWFKGKNEINFGLDVNRYSVIPGSLRPANDSSLIISNIMETERAFEGALYIDDKFKLTNYLSVSAGIRVSSFFSLGPKTTYLYSPDYSKTNSTITDTLIFRSGEISSRYAGPEFRLSLNFRVTDRNSIKINYNRTRQYIHMLSNSTSMSPTDTWKLCDYYLQPEIGDQYAIGFYQLLFSSRFETSAELYYKEIKNMIDFKGGSTLTMVQNLEQYMVNGKGKAYGIEVSLKKTEGKVRYSVGYTYSRTLLKASANSGRKILIQETGILLIMINRMI